LFCCHIFCKVGNDIASYLHGGGGPRITRSKLGINSSGVIHEIGIESGGFNLVFT